MKGLYSEYQGVNCGEEAYFVGANTGRGFVCRKDTFLREGVDLEKLIIVKGGAGTGKSTLMKKAAEEGKKRGFPVVVYRCGSDYESLDAVVIDGRIGIVDGTSPHVMEMKYPGAVSSLADLSKFLSEDKLKARKEELMSLSAEKSECYRSAYQYLKAAEILDSEIAEVSSRFFDKDKMLSYVHRTAKNFSKKEIVQRGKRKAQDSSSVYIGGITMKGQVCLSTLREMAENVIYVGDSWGFAHLFFEAMGSAFAERGVSAVIGRIPLNDRAAELYLPELRVVYSVFAEETHGRSIHLKRFLAEEGIKSEEGRLKLAFKCREALENEAYNLLLRGGKAHFTLEEINKACMDFKGLNRYCNQVISGVFGKLTTS